MDSDLIVSDGVGISQEELSYLESILPDGHNTKITKYDSSSFEHFDCTLRTALFTKSDAINWMSTFENLSFTSWRTYKSYSEETARIVFKKDYRCHHNTLPKMKSIPHEKHTNCNAKVKITVKQQSQKRSSDEELHTRPCEILLRFTHNHELKSAAALKFRKPSDEVTRAFHDLFNRGHSPSSAWQSYKFDLQLQYEDEYYKFAADGSVCPTRKWVFDLYYSLFKKEFGDSSGEGMVISLTKFINEYNDKCGSVCAVLLSKEGNLSISICDPFMKRVHENLTTAGEIMFMDSSGNMDRHNSRIFFLLCPSIAGALPLGIIITFSECEAVLTEALNTLVSLFPKGAFYGQRAPQIIITDDCSAERNSLMKSFPHSRLLLCKFHVLQAAMRYFWKSEHKISFADRKEIYSKFHRLLHIKDMTLFKESYDNALSSPLIKKYEFAYKYFFKMQPRAPEWALCFRNNLITRGNDTNNYAEANFRVLKDIVLKRTKAFSVVQLFSFLTTQMINYYKRKLTDVLNDRAEGFTQSKYYIPENKLADLNYKKTGDHFYVVTNSSNSNEYCVNIEQCICSCPIGIQGAPCKHQYFILKKENLSSTNFKRSTDKTAKQLLHKILTGEDIDSTWYTSLHQANVTSQNISFHISNFFPSTSSENDNVASIENGNIEDSEKAKLDTKQAIKTIFCDIESLVDTNPTEFIPALAKFSKSYFSCKTPSSKLSAFHTFGCHIGTAPLIKKGKNVQGGKTIPVQPTAVMRRKVHLGGRHIQQTGRPPKRTFSSEHCYAKQKSGKKRNAAPHSLNYCVENNISLGQ